MATLGQSKLLIYEHPLQVLPSLAVKYGLNEAIILQQIHYWSLPKESGKDQGIVIDGVRWIYNTYEGWQKNFPFFSERTIRRAITSLEEAGVLVSTQGLATEGRDRTKYYRIDYERLDADGADASGQNGRMYTSGQNGVMDEANLAACNKEQRLLTETTSENLSLTPFEGKGMTTRQQFIECFKAYWEYSNPGDKMPFSKADGQAIDRFIRDHPEATLQQFKRCLYHRSMSDVNPSQQLHRWIGRLTDYASGPLDKFFNPKTLGGKHGEQRNLAAENAANLDSLLPNGTAANHRGVAKGVRPVVESTSIR